ncbi:MAG: DTW domain-containing protein [Sandaracinaceae bacterium]
MSYSREARRCKRCRLHVERCLCRDVATHAVTTQLVLVPQIRDWQRPSNTARLAWLMLDAELALVGDRATPLEPASLLRPGMRHVVLHPAKDAPPLTPLEDGRPVRLLVPDGSWRQSNRIARRLVALPGVERASITPQAGPALRRRPTHDQSCTAEAIAAALEVLGDVAAAASLRAALVLLVERTRASRGW